MCVSWVCNYTHYPHALMLTPCETVTEAWPHTPTDLVADCFFWSQFKVLLWDSGFGSTVLLRNALHFLVPSFGLAGNEVRVWLLAGEGVPDWEWYPWAVQMRVRTLFDDTPLSGTEKALYSPGLPSRPLQRWVRPGILSQNSWTTLSKDIVTTERGLIFLFFIPPPQFLPFYKHTHLR